jgi:Flp pilus assembly protein protease CpaA
VGPLFEPSVVAIGVAVAIGMIAVPLELRDGQIPNALPLAGLVMAAALIALRNQAATHLLGFLLTALPGVLVYRRGVLGGGAFKLMVAIATLAGPVFALGVWAAVGFVFLRARLRPEAPDEVPSSPWICIGTGIAAGASLLLGDVGAWL